MEKWSEIEDEVDRLEYTDGEYKCTRADTLTDAEIAALAQGVRASKKNPHHPHRQHHQHHHHHHHRHNNNNNNNSTLDTITSLSVDPPTTASTELSRQAEPTNTTMNTTTAAAAPLPLDYARKKSILRKLMICQRKQFMQKRERIEIERLKKSLAETSMSNYGDAAAYQSYQAASSERSGNRK